MAVLLCRLQDLDATGAKGIALGRGMNNREIVVVRDGKDIRAYANACPHLGMPLETVPDRFVDGEGRHLVCTTHGARFAVATGLCVFGPCEGEALVQLTLRIDGDAIWLVDGPGAERC